MIVEALLQPFGRRIGMRPHQGPDRRHLDGPRVNPVGAAGECRDQWPGVDGIARRVVAQAGRGLRHKKQRLGAGGRCRPATKRVRQPLAQPSSESGS